MKRYEAPQAEVIVFENDVITASGNTDPTSGHAGGSGR